MSYMERGAEACDVTIRCYLLGQAVSEEIYRIYGKENVILSGYCEIRYIQNYLTEVGHTGRVEGWAANVFELPAPYNNIAVCTGYAPFGTKNKNARKVCERWEKLYYNYDFSQRKRMIKRFARELGKTINN